MHECPPPAAALDAWLEAHETVHKKYGHLLLEQVGPITPGDLRPYFESAHSDARKYFHSEMGIDLHPDADGPNGHVVYPNELPTVAKLGLFGEVMAGLVTERYQDLFIGGRSWTIPVFLFRYHTDAETYLFTLVRDGTKARQIFGRHGTDFMALQLDDKQNVIELLLGEAKWRKTFTDSVYKSVIEGVWKELNARRAIPHGVRQLRNLLAQEAPDKYGAAILSLDRALLLSSGHDLPWTNLVLLVGGRGKTREVMECLADWKASPPEYTAKHDLQVVEVALQDGENLIKELYESLWTEEDDDDL
jgi:hypothetical protein